MGIAMVGRAEVGEGEKRLVVLVAVGLTPGIHGLEDGDRLANAREGNGELGGDGSSAVGVSLTVDLPKPSRFAGGPLPLVPDAVEAGVVREEERIWWSIRVSSNRHV